MGSISDFGKSQDVRKSIDALGHLTWRLNPPCCLDSICPCRLFSLSI